MSVCGVVAMLWIPGTVKTGLSAPLEISPFSFLAVSAPRPSGGSASIDDMTSFEAIQNRQICVGNRKKWARGDRR